jgi:transposase InsO family protein
VSISRFVHVSRPTVDAWIQRFETEHFAGLVDRSRAPKAPARKVWLPLMVQVYHLQKAHPDAGRFRLWSLLARSDISERTVGRIMALNKLIYDDIPHVPKKEGKRVPGIRPYKASHPHQYWFIDGRQLDVRIDGVKWWSLIILEGYSRTMLAGAIAPTEATWVALMVLYTACLRYGVPHTLVSDSSGAYTSNDFEAVCRRLQLQHEAIQSTKGESYQNLMETHFNIQRRLYDYQFSLTTAPLELDQLGGEGRQPVDHVGGIAVVELDVLPLHIAKVAQALLEGRKARGGRWVRLQDADQRDVPPPLRLDSGQRHQETKGEGDDEPTVRRHTDVSSWGYR